MSDNKFVVIVPVYNSEKYIEKCLESILTQSYNNFTLIVMDDCSSDATYSIINKVHNRYSNSFIICRNDFRIGSALANLIKAMELFSHNKEDIIVTIDGDDWLANEKVFYYLNSTYQDPHIYMTYGQYVPLSKSYGKFCKQILDTRVYRRSGEWFASHLRTFKNKLFYKIKDEDLRDTKNVYYTVAWDAAFMYPMIEMCGSKHFKFIDEILYIYNDLNPTNDMKINRQYQIDTATYIRSKPLYEELKEPI